MDAVRPVRAGEGVQRRRGIVAAVAAAAAIFVVAALAANSGSRKSVLSVTFNDGPDPDAPAATDLWNNGLQGMAEAEPQREVMPANKPVNSPYSDYKYSTGGYQVQRLERVMSKIGSAEQEFSEVDRVREELAKQIAELQRKQEGLTLQANDIKADLTRYSWDQQNLVRELQPKPAEVAPLPAAKEGEAVDEPTGEEPAAEAAVEEGDGKAEGEAPAAEEPAAEEGEAKPKDEAPAAEGAVPEASPKGAEPAEEVKEGSGAGASEGSGGAAPEGVAAK